MVSPSAPAWIGISAGTNAAAATTDARVRARGDRVKLTSWPSSDAYEVSCRVRARESPGSPAWFAGRSFTPRTPVGVRRTCGSPAPASRVCSVATAGAGGTRRTAAVRRGSASGPQTTRPLTPASTPGVDCDVYGLSRPVLDHERHSHVGLDAGQQK